MFCAGVLKPRWRLEAVHAEQLLPHERPIVKPPGHYQSERRPCGLERWSQKLLAKIKRQLVMYRLDTDALALDVAVVVMEW